MPDFDYTKPFRQKNGRAARNPRPSGHPFYRWRVDVLSHGNYWTVADFNDSGKFHNAYDDDRDLINIPEPQEEAMKLDFNRPVQRRDGLAARIICTDRKGDQPVMALISHADNYEEVMCYESDGRYSGSTNRPSQYDLVNVPETREVWLYKTDANGNPYYTVSTEKYGPDDLSKPLLARKKVTITDGEFDE